MILAVVAVLGLTAIVTIIVVAVFMDILRLGKGRRKK